MKATKQEILSMINELGKKKHLNKEGHNELLGELLFELHKINQRG